MNLQVKHPLLAAPASIGGLELKNKIIMAPMGSNFAGEDGHTTEQLESYYEERAKGGVGLIILETSAITWPAGASMPYMIGFSKTNLSQISILLLKEFISMVQKLPLN